MVLLRDFGRNGIHLTGFKFCGSMYLLVRIGAKHLTNEDTMNAVIIIHVGDERYTIHVVELLNVEELHEAARELADTYIGATAFEVRYVAKLN
jgi:hypothetical protein